MRSIFLFLFFVLSMPSGQAQNLTSSSTPAELSTHITVVDNVRLALDIFDVSDLIVLDGTMNPRKSEAIGHSQLTNQQLYMKLLSRGFIKAYGGNSLQHRGELCDLRFPASPSPQVIFFPDHLELDLDRVCPVSLWTSIKHISLEIVPHGFLIHILHLNAKTNENVINKKLKMLLKEKNERQLAKGG